MLNALAMAQVWNLQKAVEYFLSKGAALPVVVSPNTDPVAQSLTKSHSPADDIIAYSAANHEGSV